MGAVDTGLVDAAICNPHSASLEQRDEATPFVLVSSAIRKSSVVDERGTSASLDRENEREKDKKS